MGQRQHRLPKAQARAYASLLGLRPVVRGHYGESKPDGISERFVAEYKARDELPALVESALHQAEGFATDGRLPIAILHRVGGRFERDVVLIRVRDFQRLVAGSCLTGRRGVPSDRR